MVINATEQKLNAVLTKYLSPLTLKAILRKARERTGEAELSEASLPAVIKSLQVSLKIFLSEGQHAEASRALELLDNTSNPVKSQLIPILQEMDIVSARTEAAKLAQRLGANRFVEQRLMTVVSELARNIVNYTKGGRIELLPLATKGIRVTATDEGKGITNIDQILSGNYRSRTGMGLGILGVKKLAKTFLIQTTPHGTFIQAEVTW
jgi:serine/threonine-protein kinase RsbT